MVQSAGVPWAPSRRPARRRRRPRRNRRLRRGAAGAAGPRGRRTPSLRRSPSWSSRCPCSTRDSRSTSGARSARSPTVRDEIRAVFESPTFDPDLGWTKRPPADNYAPGREFLAQAYGDSFTLSQMGTGGSWEDYFELFTGHAILNFGVGGYGLDQAVLAFEKCGAEYPGRIALLGLYHQMYRRAHSHHSFYYFHNSAGWRYVFKPMLIRTGGGFELLRPPCRDVACLEAVLFDESHPIRRTLAAHDLWYRQNAARPAPDSRARSRSRVRSRRCCRMPLTMAGGETTSS